MKTGLVLEGGALRGLFSAGITDVLDEQGITFDGIIGVSAGAAFGCNIKSRQPGRAIRYNSQYARDWRYCSLRSLLTTGDLFGGEFCYHYLPEHLDRFDAEAYNRNPVDFCVVCTDVETGEAVYKHLPRTGYDCYEWIRASASMPVCSKIVKLEGKKLLDGGISDSIPLRYFQQIGYERNVVVLTQPEGYVKQPNRLLPLFRVWLHRYPQFVAAAARRHEMYNAQLAYIRTEEKKGSVYVLRPDEPLPIGHVSHDPKQMQKVYELGRDMANRHIASIKEFVDAQP